MGLSISPLSTWRIGEPYTRAVAGDSSAEITPNPVVRFKTTSMLSKVYQYLAWALSNTAIRGISGSLDISWGEVAGYPETIEDQLLSNYADSRTLPAVSPWAETLGLPRDFDPDFCKRTQDVKGAATYRDISQDERGIQRVPPTLSLSTTETEPKQFRMGFTYDT